MPKLDWSSLWEKGRLVGLLDWLVHHSAGNRSHVAQGPECRDMDGSLQGASPGVGQLGPLVSLFIVIAILTGIGAAVMKRDFLRYFPGFLVIYIIAFIAMIIAGRRA